MGSHATRRRPLFQSVPAVYLSMSAQAPGPWTEEDREQYEAILQAIKDARAEYNRKYRKWPWQRIGS